MRNLQLKNFEVIELSLLAKFETNGGMGYDAGGYGLAMDRKGEGLFYKGFVNGLYRAFFG